MPSDGIPPDVREFLFEYVDSIDQLEVMLFLRSGRERAWTALEVSNELRTNPGAAETRLKRLKEIGVLESDGSAPPAYRYSPATPDMDRVIASLADVYRVRRHKIYELIFSSLKRARKFLDAFTVPGKKESVDD